MLLTMPSQAHPDRLGIQYDAVDSDSDGGWMISFVDILMLLLTLFVLLLAFHAVKQPGVSTPPAPRAAVVAAPKVETRPASPQSLPAPVAPSPQAAARVAPKGPDPFAILSNPESTAALLSALQAASPDPEPAQVEAAAPPVAAPAPVAETETQSPPALYVPPEVRDHVEVAISADAVNLVIKDDVLFDPASAELKADSDRVLDGVVAILAQNGYAVSVEGHTDDQPIHTARFPSNWDLSVARATRVTRYLIEHGIARERLRAVGYADTRPLDSADTAEARAHNRRVSLVVHVHKTGAGEVSTQAPQKRSAADADDRRADR